MSRSSKLQVPRVEVHRYFGRNGSFDVSGTWLYRCYLVGVNGGTRFGGDWMAEGSGNVNEKVAVGEAKGWAKFTGWPFINRGYVPSYNELTVPPWR